VVTPPEVTVKTPSAPEVLLFPVCPANPIARPRNVRVDPEKISTLALDRSAIKMSPVTGSAKLMSNEVNAPPGCVFAWSVGTGNSGQRSIRYANRSAFRCRLRRWGERRYSIGVLIRAVVVVRDTGR
jgi:hypothetical protein